MKHTHPALHEGIIQAYSHAIDRLFLVAAIVSAFSIIAALFIKQVQLRGSNSGPAQAEAGSAEGADTASLPAAGVH